MSKKFHIVKKGPNAGKAEKCGAVLRTCPNGGDEAHGKFDSPQEAEKWAESKMKEEFGGSFESISTDNLLSQDDHEAVRVAKIAAQNAEQEAARQAVVARGKLIDKEYAVASLNDLVERKEISREAAQFLKSNPEFTTALSRFGKYAPGAPRPLNPRTGDGKNTIEMGLARAAGSPQSLGYTDGAKIDPNLLREFEAIRSGEVSSSQYASSSEEGFSEIQIDSLPSGDQMRAAAQARQAAANLEREQRRIEANKAAKATAIQDFADLVKSGSISREKAEFLKDNPEFTTEMSRMGRRLSRTPRGNVQPGMYGADPINIGVNYASNSKAGAAGQLSVDSREKLMFFNELK